MRWRTYGKSPTGVCRSRYRLVVSWANASLRSRRVLHARMREDLLDTLRAARQRPQSPGRRLLQLGAITDRRARRDLDVAVPVHIRVRVELWRIRRKIVTRDQEALPAAVADRGEVADRWALGEDRAHGRLPLRRDAAAPRIARAEARFIAPEDLRALGGRLPLDPWVLGLEPRGDGLRPLCVRALDRLLRRDPPPREVVPHGPHRQRDSVLPRDPLHDRGAGA
jgi:hypothetical protein